MEQRRQKTVTRNSLSTADGKDRRVVGARPDRCGLIIENGSDTNTLYVGFGGEEVTPRAYSLALAPGERYIEMGEEITPTSEVRARQDGAGRIHITAFRRA
jgi:hypothetical protein